MLENLLVMISVPVLVVTRHRFRFSNVAYMVEWIAAIVVAPELGDAYLGTQGDKWDARKDMALATAGSLIAMSVLRMRQFRLPAGAVLRP